MRKADFSSAAAKFKAANEFAPKSGRNHLRLGQVLQKLGREDEARKEFAAAATYDLSAADKAELARPQNATR